jgi:N-methylhydantoinase B
MDPITFQVIQSRLSGIVQEMQDSIFRTGYSTIIRESQDASCMLMDPDGDVIGEHVVLPLHIACLPQCVRNIKASFGDDMHPGDAFLTNHPYLGGVPHSMDMAVITPFFRDGRLTAFCGSIAHKSDLGGVVPGTGYGNAREIFQEGIQYPPIRFMSRGEVVADVEAILRANSRTPELVLGDIRGQVGVARLGERRMTELLDRYGLAPALEAFALKQKVTEDRIRATLRTWPDGAFEAESWVDTDGITLDRRVRYHIRIEKQGDRILFDSTGCDDQTQGPVNIVPSLALGCYYFALIAMVDPGLPNNGGVARVVETKFREGSVLDPHFPAATNTYMAAATAITEAALQALSGFVPHKRMAGNGGVGGITISGTTPEHKAFVQYESVGSAYGATAQSDGISAITVLLSNARIAPVEVLESEFPTRLVRFELIEDSGGPGRYRGGLVQRRTYEILTDDAQLTLRGGRHEVPAFGLSGGKPGRLGSCVLAPGAENERRMPSRFSGLRLRSGDRVMLERAGGGGFGDPHAREFEEIVDDVIDGYVSRRAAIDDYAVDAGRLDEALTRWEAGSREVARAR